MFDVITRGVKVFRINMNTEKGKRVLLRISLGIYIVAFVLMIYGMVWGADNFRIREIDIDMDERYGVGGENFRSPHKIVLISDLHLACWRNPQSLEKAITMVNEQLPDLIFITGDVVQFVSEEMVGYLPILSQLKAKLGIFSVLGNHDYGRYARFATDSLRREDVNRLVLFQTLMGWKVLNNESVRLYHDSIPLGITIAGVEFYSPKRHFINEGDLVKTFQHVDSCDYVILLSHNPQAWHDVVYMNLPANLTVSGHTHGMQLGIYFKKLKFSPASILYRQWGGLYEKQGKLLYVNVGLGSVGFPARVGIPPEITVIRLLEKTN
jgi:predicted MPP superfamily phosphohydrolase